MNTLFHFRKYLLAAIALAAVLAAALPFGAPTASAQSYCGTPTVVSLLAGQTINAGTVTVANDNVGNLYVTYSTAGTGWLLTQTHLHLGLAKEDIPQTKTGNPKIGNFAYQTTHNPAVETFTYGPFQVGGYAVPGQTFVIAAHAVVLNAAEDGSVETAWGQGKPMTDKGSWAMFIEYSWQPCDVPPPPVTETETAFAYGGGTNAAGDDTTTCFLAIDANNDGNGDFNRWGWTNGPLSEGTYEFKIYAGAGQCDVKKGTHVGTLTVQYLNGTAEVSFDMLMGTPYTMIETHLYVGSEILPTNNGEFTVAPGQYPTIHGTLDNVTTDSYQITGLSGNIYVVAHATVDGFPPSDK